MARVTGWLWMFLDGLAHNVMPSGRGIGWLCDRYDLSLGITKAELKRTRP